MSELLCSAEEESVPLWRVHFKPTVFVVVRLYGRPCRGCITVVMAAVSSMMQYDVGVGSNGLNSDFAKISTSMWYTSKLRRDQVC